MYIEGKINFPPDCTEDAASFVREWNEYITKLNKLAVVLRLVTMGYGRRYISQALKISSRKAVLYMAACKDIPAANEISAAIIHMTEGREPKHPLL